MHGLLLLLSLDAMIDPLIDNALLGVGLDFIEVELMRFPHGVHLNLHLMIPL